MTPLKKISPSLIGIAWLISLGVVFFLGILLSFAIHLKPDEGAADDAMTLADRELKLVIEKLSGNKVDFQVIKSVAQEDSFPQQLEDSLIQAMLWKDAEERRYLVQVLAKGLPLRKVMASIKYLQSQPASPGVNEALQVFLNRWAVVDGRSALAYVLSLEGDARRDYFTNAVLQGWASVSPQEAWNWVGGQTISSRLRLNYYEGIVDGLSTAQTDLVLGLIRGLSNLDYVLNLSLVVLRNQLEIKPIRNVLPELSQYRKEVMPELVLYLGELWSIEEPELALNWMKANGASSGDLDNALENYTWTDPQGAIAWTLNNVEPANLKLNLERIALAWMDLEGPAPLAEWINTRQPSPLLDGAIRQLALTTAELDKVTGLQWAESIFNEEERTIVEIMIGESWIESDPDEAYSNLAELLAQGPSRDYFFATNETITVTGPVEESPVAPVEVETTNTSQQIP